MHIIRNSILCFAVVSVMSVFYARSQSLNTRLPNEALQQPGEPPVSSSENGNSEITSSGHGAADTMSAEPYTAETHPPDEEQRNAAAGSLQLTDNNMALNAARQTGSSSPQPPVTRQRHDQSSTDNGLLRAGIGVQCGVRFHRPHAFNAFVTDLWYAYIAEKYDKPDKKRIGPGVLLTLNGTVDIGPLFHVTPFLQGMWAGKQFYFRGGLVKDFHVNTYTAMGGLNFWIRILNRERFAIRLGAGGYAAHTIVSFTGDLSETRISGTGYGLRGLLGTEVRLNRQVVLTLDCSVPYGVSELSNKGRLKTSGASVSYPTKLEHNGFELNPGIMFYF
jgi:hypothetical protein